MGELRMSSKERVRLEALARVKRAEQQPAVEAHVRSPVEPPPGGPARPACKSRSGCACAGLARGEEEESRVTVLLALNG